MGLETHLRGLCCFEEWNTIAFWMLMGDAYGE